VKKNQEKIFEFSLRPLLFQRENTKLVIVDDD